MLLDGLIASPAPEVLVPHARRLRQVVLVHMPLGDRRRARPRARARGPRGGDRRRHDQRLDAGAGWGSCTRCRPTGCTWPSPASTPAALAPGSAAGDALLCVAAVTRAKGHDVLLDGLATATDLAWRCACVGSLDRDPAFADRVRRRALGGGLRDRVRFAGPRTGAALDRAYAAADLLVLASHAETYGMVVTEALARGLPVLATDVGGVPEALGHGDDGTRPGLLVPPGDPAALGAALRRWLGDAGAARAPAPGRAGAARRRCAGGRPRRPSASRWPALLGGSGAMSAPAVRVSPRVARPARAGRRGGALGRARRAPRAAPRPAGRLVIHDLGGGSGAMGRWLAPRLPGPQHWVVHDRDADLLELAVADRPRAGRGHRRGAGGPTSPA